MSEEKKLTDEEIAKAILQQIEYNAGIPYINEWQQVKTVKFTEILDFINRLQSNNDELKKDYIELDLEARELRTENDKQKAEIERLKINLANEKKWGKIQAKQAEKETARKILQAVGDIVDDGDDRFKYKDYQWHKRLCEHYDIEVDYEN